MKRVLCIYHRIDLDGWMSAAIVKKAVRSGEEEFVWLGFNYGDSEEELKKILPGFDKVILVDLSLSPELMDDLYTGMGENFIWIDHHASAMRINNPHTHGLRDVTKAACELAWGYFFPHQVMPELVRLLGRYDCIAHKGTPEETLVLEFQYGAREMITNVDEAFSCLHNVLAQVRDGLIETSIWRNGKSIYRYLCQEAKSIYSTGFSVNFVEPTGRKPGSEMMEVKPRRFVLINRMRFNPVNFGIDYHADGYDGAACFHYENGQWAFSLYNENGKVDCSEIARGFGGGGHKGAAGFRISDISKIIG